MNVPKLRFKEFNDEWKTDTLGNLGKFKNGINKGKEAFGFGIPFVNLLDVFNKNHISNTENLNLVNVSNSEILEYSLEKGDVLFVRSSVKTSGVGLTCLIDETLENTVYSGFLIRFRENKNKIMNIYKRYYFYNSFFRNVLIKKSTKSANININQDNLSPLNVSFPSKEEQAKIGTFLSLLDKKIELQTKKIDALKLYKIYIKSILFNGNNNICKLGSILTKWNEKNKNEKITYVESISNKYGFISQSEQFEERNIASKDLKNYYVIRKNVFGYNPSRLNVGSLALKENDEVSVVSPLYECFTTNQNCKFLLEWFDSKFFKKETLSKFEGGVRNTLNFTNLCEIEINLPSVEKQNKYAKILSTFGKKIINETDKLSKLESLKKGLMQNMFV